MSEADLPSIVNCKKDYYSILGVALESTEAQVRAAYLRLALVRKTFWLRDFRPRGPLLSIYL